MYENAKIVNFVYCSKTQTFLQLLYGYGGLRRIEVFRIENLSKFIELIWFKKIAIIVFELKDYSNLTNLTRICFSKLFWNCYKYFERLRSCSTDSSWIHLIHIIREKDQRNRRNVIATLASNMSKLLNLSYGSPKIWGFIFVSLSRKTLVVTLE